MRITVRQLKQVIRESIDEITDELNTIEIGDVVEVDTEWGGILTVRVVELVDDVRSATGYTPGDPSHMPDAHTDEVFQGPGFVGEIDSREGESGQLVFSAEQIMPGSKAQGYFPKLGVQTQDGNYQDWDDWGRDKPNPYRQMARRDAVSHRERGR